ncbi:MAG: RidA family protein [Pirellulales bacterium]|nr:RidA family protein [Pirellulales bacterium]
MSSDYRLFESIAGRGVPSSDLPFSPAVRCGEFVFVSGQASVDGEGRIVSDTFSGEMRRSFENLRHVLAGAGLTLRNVVKLSAFVAQQEDLPEFNRIYREYFDQPYPARTTIVGCLGDLLKFEVDAIAVHPPLE